MKGIKTHNNKSAKSKNLTVRCNYDISLSSIIDADFVQKLIVVYKNHDCLYHTKYHFHSIKRTLK